MPNVHQELRAAGIELADDVAGSALRIECARVARLVRERLDAVHDHLAHGGPSRGRLVHAVGLAPAGDDVAVPGVAIELGRALAVMSTGPVGVVDVHGTWPGARGLVEAAAPDGTLATSWLLDKLAVLTPRSHDVNAQLADLRSVVVDKASVFGHLVVDLTGLDHLGEHLAAFELLDAVFLVARSGRTTARQIQRWLREFPEGHRVSVLLTGV